MTDWSGILGWLVTVTLAAPPATEPQLTVDGLVRLVEVVDVPARRDGRLEKFTVKEGAYVHKGDALGRLDDAEAQFALKRVEVEHQLAVEKANSEITLKSARLIEEVSRNEFQRARQVKQSSPSSISTSEVDRLKLDAEKATNEVARLTEEKRFALLTSQIKAFELESSRLALEERQLVSPLDGIVVALHRREGEWVHVGEKVIRVVRIDRLRVEAFINLQTGLTQLENAPVVLEVGFPDAPVQEFAGEIVFLNPEADPVNGQIRVWAEIENRDRMLRPGQRGRLKVFSKKPAQPIPAVTIPPTSDTKPGK